MKTLTSFGLVVALGLLSACGGDDGGGGGSGSTPPPSPPPPPPPPAVSYTKFADLTGEQAFQTGCAGIAGPNERLDAFGFGRYPEIGTTISIDYAAAAQSWRTVGMSVFGKPFDWTFTRDMIQPSPPPDSVYYRKSNADGTTERLYVIAKPLGTVVPEYVRTTLLTYRLDTDPPEFRYCAFGVPTKLEDTRPTTTVTYSATAVSGLAFFGNTALAQYDLGESTVSVSANPTTGEVPVTINLVGREFTPAGLSETRVNLGTYSGTADVSPTVQSFTDALRDSPDRAILGGNFAGWFFGPQGREIGFAYSVRAQSGDGSIVNATGVVTGRR